MTRLLGLVLVLACGCPPAAERSSAAVEAGAPAACVRVGQGCEYSPGKLGTCVARDDCKDPAGCFVCQSQH
jgi:hypothetical protein